MKISTAQSAHQSEMSVPMTNTPLSSIKADNGSENLRWHCCHQHATMILCNIQQDIQKIVLLLLQGT